MNAALQAKLARAGAYLERFQGHVLGHFIDGRPCTAQGAGGLDNLSPVDGTLLNRVAEGGAAEVDAAAVAARRSFDAWRATPGEARRKILHKVADSSKRAARRSRSSNAWIPARRCDS